MIKIAIVVHVHPYLIIAATVMQPSLILSYWRRQSIKMATSHPKITLGILSLLAAALLLAGMSIGTDDLSNVGDAAQEGMQAAVSHISTRKVPGEALVTDLCTSEGSLQHTPIRG